MNKWMNKNIDKFGQNEFEMSIYSKNNNLIY